MNRALLAIGFPALGLGLAAAFVAPSAVQTGGEPMLVAGMDAPILEPVAFAGSACKSTLLFAERAAADNPQLRLVALDLSPGSRGLTVRVREVPPGGTVEQGEVVVLVTASGQIVAADNPAWLAGGWTESMTEDCATPAQVRPQPGAI